MRMLRRGIQYFQSHGLGVLLSKMRKTSYEYYFRPFERWLRRQATDSSQLSVQKADVIPNPPLISVVVPVYNTQPALLESMVESVLNQTYVHFELVLLDGGSTPLDTIEALESLRARDKRIKLYRAEKNLGISGNTNLAIEKSIGEFVALLDHDDELSPDALYYIAQAIVIKNADFIYSDEVKLSYDGRFCHTPFFKPDFSPDLLRATNYICHLMVLKKSLLNEVGWLNPDFDGSQDHDLALRLTEKANNIVHIPRILYRWRDVKTSMSRQNQGKCADATVHAVKDHLCRKGVKADVYFASSNTLIRYCKPDHVRISIIVDDIDNKQNNAWYTHNLGRFSDEIIFSKQGKERYRSLNEAAERAEGDILIFIDSKVKIITPELMETLIGRAMMNDAGAVGPAILLSNAYVRHQGYLVNINGPLMSSFRGHSMAAWGYFGLNHLSRNVSALSTAFMVVRRKAFFSVGGFDIDYRHAFGDADFCIRLMNKGFFNVIMPECRVKSHRIKGKSSSIADEGVHQKDATRFSSAHGKFIDLFYNPNLKQDGSYRY